MTTAETTLRVRPSVAFVPVGDGVYQFFLGNTRQARVFKLEPSLASLVSQLSGRETLADVASATGVPIDRAVHFARSLVDACLVEDARVAARMAASPWRRVLNFLGDYFPTYETEGAFQKMSLTPVVILGVGAVGSWVAIQLARTGFRQICLIDSDVVSRSNLNRSLYEEPDVGRRKVSALAEKMRRISSDVEVSEIPVMLEDSAALMELLPHAEAKPVVVNCADQPSVDATSLMVDAACQRLGAPYVIAGGYNLHLSLVGITVLPGRTACFRCSAITLQEAQGRELDDVRKLARPWRNIGNLGPLAAITASFAVNEVIRVALQSERLKPAMLNRRGEFNFLTNQLHFTPLLPRNECGCLKSGGGPSAKIPLARC